MPLTVAIAGASKPTTPATMVLARDASINALATGWDEADAVVAVTRGALEHLTREELQGLVAHELSHLRVMDHSPQFWDTVASVMPDYLERRQALHKLPVPKW